jgi:hypothetical protein
MKQNDDADCLVRQLDGLEFGELLTLLNSDRLKFSFWINVYNAAFLYMRKHLDLKKPGIYTRKVIPIAGEVFSLDDIEHGILRKYRWKYSKGYLPTIRVRRIIRLLTVENIDYRIHFALNCGARSCPPIQIYEPEKIDHQLDLATNEFLKNNTSFSHAKKEMYLSRIFLWYKGDFGGRQGIRKLMEDIFGKEIRDYKLRHQSYDWTEVLDNFSEEAL